MAGTKRGPIKIELDHALLAKLCQIQCTMAECAAVLGMSEKTLQRRLGEDMGAGFAEVSDDDETGFEPFFAFHSTGGKASIRRAQFKVALGEPPKSAEHGLPATEGIAPDKGMLIWLGKQILGQKDRQDVVLADPEGKAIRFTVGIPGVTAPLALESSGVPNG